MVEYRFCPQCGQELEGRDLRKEGFHPWCGSCNRVFFQPVPLRLIALIQREDGSVLLQENDHFPLFPVRYREWLEDAFHRGFSGLFRGDPLCCEYLNSFWEDGEGVLLIAMKSTFPSSDMAPLPPPLSRWCPLDQLPETLTEIERQLLSIL